MKTSEKYFVSCTAGEESDELPAELTVVSTKRNALGKLVVERGVYHLVGMKEVGTEYIFDGEKK